MILIENGRILQKELTRTRISQDELICHLRSSGVLDIRSVQFAILETNGKVSVFPFPKDQPATAKAQHLPITLSSDGRLLSDNLARSGKDRAWLDRTLREKGADMAGTWMLSVDDGGTVVFVPREDSL